MPTKKMTSVEKEEIGNCHLVREKFIKGQKMDTLGNNHIPNTLCYLERKQGT